MYACVRACVYMCMDMLNIEAWMEVDGWIVDAWMNGWMIESSRQREQTLQKLRGQRKCGDSS